MTFCQEIDKTAELNSPGVFKKINKLNMLKSSSIKKRNGKILAYYKEKRRGSISTGYKRANSPAQM